MKCFKRSNSPHVVLDGNEPITNVPKPFGKPQTTRFVYLVNMAAVIGGFLFGYDTGVVSSAMMYIPDALGLDYMQEQLVISITMVLCAVFSLIGGLANETFGRRPTIMFASAMFTVGAILLSAANGFPMLITGRAILGAAIGLSSMSVPPYVAECAPCHVRGVLLLSFQLMVTIGIFLANLFGGIFSLDAFDPQNVGWRLMLGTAAIPAVVQFIAFLFLPESPRILVAKGDVSGAQAVLDRMYSTKDANWRQFELSEILHQQREIERSRKQHAGRFVFWSMLTTNHVRKALLIGCSVQCFQQLCGVNTIVYYQATIIKMSGVTDSNTAIWISCAFTFIKVLTTLVPMWIVDKVGRRVLLLWSTVGVIVALFIVAGGFIGISTTAAKVDPAEKLNLTELRFELESGSTNIPIDQWHQLLVQAEDCVKKTTCDTCVTPETCGFCYLNTNISQIRESTNTFGACLPAQKGNSERSWIGACNDTTQFSHQSNDGRYIWAWNYCLSPYGGLVLAGILVYTVAFGIGLGPIAWVINAEIYPNWARSTGAAVATFTNWSFNFMMSQTFLMLTVAITKYGAFLLYAGFTLIGLIIFIIWVPETKGLQIDEVENIFKQKNKIVQEEQQNTNKF